MNLPKCFGYGWRFRFWFCISVRDAAARLPNGEGTRAEICELLKDSQFLAPDVTSAQVSWMPCLTLNRFS